MASSKSLKNWRSVGLPLWAKSRCISVYSSISSLRRTNISSNLSTIYRLLKNWRSIILIFFYVLFFFGTFFFTRPTDLFISPDETANAFFARQYSETGSFRVFDELNSEFGGDLHPRSMVSYKGTLVPSSFLGLPFLYAIAMYLFGGWILTFLTPIVAIAAAYAWGRVLKRWFSPTVATVSGLLLLFHPAFWYYSARGLMHNVLFVSLLIFACFFLFCLSNKKSAPSSTPRLHDSTTLSLFLSGFFTGLALFVRLSEAIWVLPFFVFLIWTERRVLSKHNVALMIGGFLIPIILMLWLNQTTYGSVFMNGYVFETSQVREVGNAGEAMRSTVTLFPFGFDLRAAAKHIFDYLLSIFWWLSGLALIGLPIVLINGVKETFRARRAYVVIGIVLTAWLGIWYGSWTVFDNPDPTLVTIANSYARYWLPLFVLSTPFIASAIVWITERARTVFARRMFLAICLLLVVWMNTRVVFFEGQDALRNTKAILNQSREIRNRVFEIASQDSVIIVDRADKIFFPSRHVLYPFRSEKTYAMIPSLVERVSLYYYGVTLPQKDLDYLNEKKLVDGSQIEFVESFGIESLYRFISR